MNFVRAGNGSGRFFPHRSGGSIRWSSLSITLKPDFISGCPPQAAYGTPRFPPAPPPRGAWARSTWVLAARSRDLGGPSELARHDAVRLFDRQRAAQLDHLVAQQRRPLELERPSGLLHLRLEVPDQPVQLGLRQISRA